VSSHPNTIASVVSGGAVTFLLWVATLLGIDIGPVEAGFILTIGVGAVLFIGRRGIRGLARLIWRGEPNL
jgi:hypothetical protein